MRAYIEGEAAKLERFYSPLIDCHITITHENRTRRADFVVRLHAQVLKASHEDEKAYAAIDGAMEKMARQLKRLNDKRRRPRSGAARGAREEIPVNEE
jgi:ribosomal subunit interface protein